MRLERTTVDQLNNSHYLDDSELEQLADVLSRFGNILGPVISLKLLKAKNDMLKREKDMLIEQNEELKQKLNCVKADIRNIRANVGSLNSE